MGSVAQLVEQATFNREVPGSSPGGPTIAPEEATRPGVRRPPHLLWAAGVAALAIALILLGGMMTSRWPFAFDRAILLALRDTVDPSRPIGPGWLRPTLVDITTLGGVTVLTMAVVATAVVMIAQRLWWTAALVVAATVSGSLAVAQLKQLVGRPRPALVDHLVTVGDLSFPSGHAANSAIVYLTLAALTTQVEHGWVARNAVIALAVMLVGMIGISRVYLGVHWPSDVLAGWSFGTLWALGWWLVGARLRQPASG